MALEDSPSRNRFSPVHVVDTPRPNNYVCSNHLLVKFTPSVLVGPHLLIGLCRYLQSCRYVWDSNQLIELHSEIMFWGRTPSCACPGLGPFIGFFRPLFLCGRFVNPHRLRPSGCSRLDRTDETLLMRYSIICGNVC